mgnify:CR=1 FL=1|tara:strand:- start:53 stop:796 length:744 start_codon:yes stop_codon:yes gene_type:complete
MQPQVLGITAAVVLSGLAYWQFTKDDKDETTTTTTTTVAPTGGVVTPPEEENEDADAVSCEDDFGCPADRSHCESGECVEATSKFKTHSGSLYPDYGGSDLMKPDARKNIVGSEACAKACLDDPDCLAFTHWEERYNADNPKVDGEDPTWEESNRCYFWSGPQGTDTTISPKQAVGPAHEGVDIEDNPEAHNSVATTYILADKEDYVPTQTSEAENVENPFYTPATQPSGSGYIISDNKTEVNWRQW